MSEEFDPSAESDLRRRAAWLLGMLVVVAALVVVISVVVLGGSGGSNNTVADPDISATGSSPAPVIGPSVSATPSGPGRSDSARSGSTSASTSPSSGSSSTGKVTCPGQQVCVLDGDVGNAGDAINAYRTKNGRAAVPVTVGTDAQKCALNNGGGCSGGWAETQLAAHDGDMAVQKILQFAKLLDANVKSIQIGWAYDPGAKQYYFALIRQD